MRKTKQHSGPKLPLMADGFCINCGCAMRKGRHQDGELVLHGDLCPCNNAIYGQDSDEPDAELLDSLELPDHEEPDEEGEK
jgi:hypothetical protein